MRSSRSETNNSFGLVRNVSARTVLRYSRPSNPRTMRARGRTRITSTDAAMTPPGRWDMPRGILYSEGFGRQGPAFLLGPQV